MEFTVESISLIIQSAFQRFKDLYLKSWGDPGTSHAGKIPIPVDPSHRWIPCISMSVSSKLIVRNLDGANDIEITWNDSDQYGLQIDHGDKATLDDMVGTAYLRCVDPTKTATVNYLAVGVRS
jgi:hypothetical protein